MKNTKSIERALLGSGLLMICAGLIANEMTLARFISPDGALNPTTIILIRIFDCFMILAGLVIILSRSSEILPNILISLSTLVVVLAAIEIIFFILSGDSNRAATVTTSADFVEDDGELGYAPKPNMTVTSTSTIDDSTIFEVTYTTDHYGRRMTLSRDNQNKSKFILFFGGSFTFGMGVNDDETLASLVAQQMPEYRCYNYGFNGYGPNQMLARLQADGFVREIEEQAGIAIYVFTYSHVSRAVGSLYVYSHWGRHTPFYTIGEGNRLVRKGSFVSGRPFVSAVYELLGQSHTLQFLQLDLPPLGRRHFELTARIIAQAREEFVAKFRSDDFYVLFYPGSSRFASELIPHLRQAEVNYFDYSELFDHSSPAYHILGDGHPNPAAYRIVAEQLANDLSHRKTSPPVHNPNKQ